MTFVPPKTAPASQPITNAPYSEAGDRALTERTSRQNPVQFIKKERAIRKSFVETSIPNLKIFLGDLQKNELKKP